MADYETTAKKFAASEERLIKLLDELQKVRVDCRASNYQDHNIAARGEKIFDDAEKERIVAQALFDKLVTLHKSHWQREYEKQINLAREALVPLVRAWRIAHRAQGAIGHFPTWVNGKFDGELIAEIIARTEHDEHQIPLDPPGSLINHHHVETGKFLFTRRDSFALTRADDELRKN